MQLTDIKNKSAIPRLAELVDPSMRSFFIEEPGVNHYWLIEYLCRNLDLVFDVGTYKGASAIAASVAKKVITFDVQDQGNKLPANVERVISSKFYEHPDLLKAQLIIIDIDPHNGKDEAVILEELKVRKYKGLLLFDDIYYDGMKDFWRSIADKKEVAKFGHYTGTGLVYL